ncbi:uncharacterized protein C2orf81 homolog isoform X1 [Syngnathoides biaculeatus]|uniref:uncharacterized protein C2orf81 homolog isoform X1 n=1 Tax=Syngnathoides biaculeatus TaxID=300417 RepID=UPI002ADDE4F1|nr:uncharacterized protein C2orf81 homolog isoform X1 [Syngnathoides biaculeatus]
MSRSTSKAQADKSKAPPRVSPPPSHEPEEEDIIPGCLTQSQWMDMLVQEEAEDVVGEIMADLMTKVMEGCYSVHIERQLSSFTAYWAKDYFIKTVEQKIMCRDRGEDSMELSATEDSEPIPITPDVWAEGCFPVIHGAPPSEPESPQINQEADICEDLEPDLSEENQQNDLTPQTAESPVQSDEKISPREGVEDKIFKEPSVRPKQNTSTKKKLKVSFPPKLYQGTVLPPVSCSAEKIETKGENKLPSVSKLVITSSQQLKETQTIRKLEQSSLPRHWITPQYEIDKSTKSSMKSSSRQSKLAQGPRSQQTATLGTSWNPPNTDQPERLSPIKDERMMARALRMDTIDLAKGVSLTDPQRIQIGPLQFRSQAQSANLKPINSESVNSPFPVNQMTTGRPPRVTQLLPSDKFKY